MSIYGGDPGPEGSLEFSAERLYVEGPGCQYAMSYPSQEPSLPSDLWYSPGPQTLPPTLTSEPHYMLPGEQSPPGHYNTACYGAHHKTVGHNPGASMFPQYIKKDPCVVSDHALHPNPRVPQFINQEPGMHVNNNHPQNRLDLANRNGSLHVQHADLVRPNISQHHSPLHQHPHQGVSLYTGLSQLHNTVHGSGPYIHDVPYIKQEPGLNMNHIPVQARQEPGNQNKGATGLPCIKLEPGLLIDVDEHATGSLRIKQEPGLPIDVNEAATGPLRIKNEPGLLIDIKHEPGQLIDINQEAGTAQSLPLHALTDHSLTPFPSKPINFNFMADIEDIVQPTSSGNDYGIMTSILFIIILLCF